MKTTVLRMVAAGSVLVIVVFVVVVINQTSQLVALATQLHPWVGSAVLWSLLALYVFCLAVPAYLLLRLPKPIKPPKSMEDPAYPQHMELLKARLRRNKLVAGLEFNSVQEVESGLGRLDAEATDRVKKAASQVFITTSISQNGSLDAFLVLAAQGKLVLEIARVYYQRPTVRDLLFLYTNVAATAFVAGEIEDIDLAEQMQPMIAALFGSTAGVVPGLGPAMTVATNSVLGGTANAFLTLRVGIITQQYCRAVVLPERRSVRRLAAGRAAVMLGGIAVAGSRRVLGAVGQAGKRKLGTMVDGATEGMRAAGSGIVDAGLNAAIAAGSTIRNAADSAAAAASAAGENLSELTQSAAERLRYRRQLDQPRVDDSTDTE